MSPLTPETLDRIKALEAEVESIDISPDSVSIIEHHAAHNMVHLLRQNEDAEKRLLGIDAKQAEQIAEVKAKCAEVKAQAKALINANNQSRARWDADVVRLDDGGKRCLEFLEALHRYFSIRDEIKQLQEGTSDA